MDLDLDRQNRIQTALIEANLDALLCAAPSQVLLLTGYWPIMGASVAIVTRSGEVHVIAPEDEADLVRATSGATLTTYTPGVLDTILDPVEALATPLLDLLHRLSLTHAHLGMELGYTVQPASYLTQVQFRSSLVTLLQERRPNIRISPCDPLAERLKAVKTPRELDLLRQACAASSAGFAVAKAAIHPGAREIDIAATLHAAFEQALPNQPDPTAPSSRPEPPPITVSSQPEPPPTTLSSRPEPQAQWTDSQQSQPQTPAFHRSSAFFFCMSGPNSATASAAYARTRTRRIAPADLVMIHANTSGDGLWTDVTRTYTAPGAPVPDLHSKIRAAITAARAAALATIRPGTLAHDVDQAVRTVMTQHGFGPQFVHGAGHGVGFAAANGNAHPRIHPSSTDTLETGMTFNIEPAAYFPGIGGMRHCDVFAVTPTGVEVLTNF